MERTLQGRQLEKAVSLPSTKKYRGRNYHLLTGIYTKPEGDRYAHQLRRKGAKAQLHKVGRGRYRVYART